MTAGSNGDGDLERKLARLTEAERRVLDLMAAGCDRETVADRVRLPVNEVRSHIQNLLTKLEVHSSLEAIALLRGREKPG